MPYLAFNLNDGNEFIFDLLEDRLTLGRNPRNEIVIDNSYISSFHAELVRQADGSYEVRDLKSANGTFINGMQIDHGILKMDDRIRFGQLDARLRDAKPPDADQASKEFPPTANEQKSDLPTGDIGAVTAKLRGTDRIMQTATQSTDGIAAHHEEAKKTLESELARLRSEHDRRQQEFTELEMQHQSKVNELATLTGQTIAQQERVEELTRQQELLDGRILMLQTTENEAKERLSEMTARAAELETVLSERKQARDELNSSTTELERTTHELQERKSELQATSATLEGVREATTHMQSRQRESEAQALIQENEAKSVQTKIESLTSQVAEKSSLLEQLAGRREAMINSVSELEREDAALRDSISVQTENVRVLEQSLSARQNEIAEIGTTEQSLAQSRAALLETDSELAMAREALANLSHVRADETAARESLQQSINRREEEEGKAAQLEVDNAGAQKLLEENRSQLASLQEQNADLELMREKLTGQLAEYQARHETALTETEAAEQMLSDLQINVQTREGIMSGQIEELTTRVDDLRREEDGLSSSLQASRERLQKNESAYHELEKKLADKELAYSEFTHSGDKLVSLSEALSHMVTREQEVGRHLTEVAEQELSTQVKLSSLDEEIAREQHRLEQVRHLREHEDQEHRRAMESSAGMLEEARRLMAEQMKREESTLSLRLKERIHELEEKHETLRQNLSTSMDEKTVIVFAGDLIKRIDLVDILIQRFSASGTNVALEQQLRTLRASLEDILAQHGIHEFTTAAGTEVDVDLRLRITIVESIPGPGRPKVVESYRPGFIYAAENGRELILRKVEVKTSNT